MGFVSYDPSQVLGSKNLAASRQSQQRLAQGLSGIVIVSSNNHLRFAFYAAEVVFIVTGDRRKLGQVWSQGLVVAVRLATTCGLGFRSFRAWCC